MKSKLVNDLRGPRSSEPLELTVIDQRDGEVVAGVLTEPSGNWYPIIDAVPRLLVSNPDPEIAAFAQRHQLDRSRGPFSESEESDGDRTRSSFSSKWEVIDRYGQRPQEADFLLDWYCRKFGVRSVVELRRLYASKKRVLEVGCGPGFHVGQMAGSGAGEVFAVDNGSAAIHAYQNTRQFDNVHVIQADLLNLPFAAGGFDFVVADGVLHHTPSTRDALRAVHRQLKPGGMLFFYVYKQMGPIREFSDSFIRERMSRMDPASCRRACEAFTELGRELSRLGASITLEKPLDLIGIPAGTHDVQRLFYYSVLKCFWNDAFDFDTNNMVNYDWYHPHFAWKHTESELRNWLAELDAEEICFRDANPNGHSVTYRRVPEQKV